jgi:hypothetical protein
MWLAAAAAAAALLRVLLLVLPLLPQLPARALSAWLAFPSISFCRRLCKKRSVRWRKVTKVNGS